jgi:hypothetical protein
MAYRAYYYVRQGIADEHAYNMFMSFEEICCRVGLWENSVGWMPLVAAFSRLTVEMPKSGRLSRN